MIGWRADIVRTESFGVLLPQVIGHWPYSRHSCVMQTLFDAGCRELVRMALNAHKEAERKMSLERERELAAIIMQDIERRRQNAEGKLYLLLFTLLYFTLLYSTLLYSTLLYFTLLCFTLLYFTLLYFTLFRFISSFVVDKGYSSFIWNLNLNIEESTLLVICRCFRSVATVTMCDLILWGETVICSRFMWKMVV